MTSFSFLLLQNNNKSETFQTSKKEEYVDNIQLESWGMKQYKKKYAFKNLKLENYSVKMIDSLQVVNEK